MGFEVRCPPKCVSVGVLTPKGHMQTLSISVQIILCTYSGNVKTQHKSSTNLHNIERNDSTVI